MDQPSPDRLKGVKDAVESHTLMMSDTLCPEHTVAVIHPLSPFHTCCPQDDRYLYHDKTSVKTSIRLGQHYQRTSQSH